METIQLPEDFKLRIYEKSIINNTEILIIYFDEDIWDIDNVGVWAEYIHIFFDKPLIMLPKSFSELQSLTYEQALELRNKCNKVIENEKKS